jgi:hypothetical protein
MNQGLAYFPGIQQIVGCSVVCSHGISPGSIVLTIAPQLDFEAEGGTLTISDGNSSVAFPDCKVDRHSLERNSAGLIWRLTILDRRWKWAWGQISGSYNLCNDDGSFRSDTAMSPQGLAALCLNALGETGYNVGRLPNTARPWIEWNFDRPAAALAQLCDELGCRVVLRLDNTVSIEVIGLGNQLPTDGIADNSLTIDPPEQPDQMAVACGRDRFQVDFPLQAVGLNSDNTWVPIDQLSYRPAAGWSAVDLPYFTLVAEADRQQAKATVFRCYQIAFPAFIPDYGSVAALAQIAPIEQEQVETASVTTNLVVNVVNKPAQIYGSYFPGNDGLRNNCRAAAINPLAFQSTLQEYKQDFVIDQNLGMVKFSDYVYSNASDFGGSQPYELTPAAATLYLRVACSVSDPSTRAPVRYTRTRNYGQQFGTPTRYLAHEEIVLTHVPVYGSNYSVQSVTTNGSDVNNQCDYYLDAAEQAYQTTYPETIRYVGVRGDIGLDGAIQQIVFEIGPGGCTTTASRNDEQVHKYPSYNQRRALDTLSAVHRLISQNKPAAMRQNIKALELRKG